jgi:hypothetical protein
VTVQHDNPPGPGTAPPSIWARIRWVLSKKRPYAGYWDHPEKHAQEYDVARCFLEALAKQGDDRFSEPRLGPGSSVAPEIIVTSAAGEVALEVTELVSRDAIEENRRRRRASASPGGELAVYRDWELAEVLSAIAERIRNKDDVRFRSLSPVVLLSRCTRLSPASSQAHETWRRCFLNSRHASMIRAHPCTDPAYLLPLIVTP